MSEFTPSNESLRYAWREMRLSRSWDEADAEFERWLAAHDQSIRDAVKPPELTAKEHLKAAWDAAHPVPPNGRIPKGTKYLTRCGGQDVVTAEAGIDLRGGPDIRTLEPLPMVIPDDCMAVWASTRGDESRRVWVRVNGGRTGREDEWDDGNLDAWFAETSELIDPKPVPEEES